MAPKTSCCCPSEGARIFRPDSHLPAPPEIHDRSTNTNVDTGMQTKNLSYDSPTTFLPPVHCIPNELFSDFFLFCLSGSPALPVPFLDLQTDTLWSILQVCRLWRNIAFSTPRLWCTLLIDLVPLESSPPPHYAHLHTRLFTCLSHSGPSLPLSFALTGGTQLGHHESNHFILPLWTSLCNFSHRWSTVYLSPYITNIISSSEQLAPLGPGRNFNFRHLSLSTPNLTPLSLLPHFASSGFGFTQIPDGTQFTSTPHLSRLALHNYHPQPQPHSPIFCSTLTHLHLDSCPYPIYSVILPSLPSLTHLEISHQTILTRGPDTTITRTHPTLLPNLRFFKATAYSGTLCLLLPLLDLPIIQQVKLTAIEEQCHPCTCAVIKRRIINEWAAALKKTSTSENLQVTLTYTPSPPSSTDDGLLHFLFSDLD